MGGNKTKTQQVQQQQQNTNTTNTYGYVPGAESSDINAMRNFTFSGDPRLPYTFARARRGVESAYSNPFGSYTTPQLRDATLASSYEDIGQEEAQAQREENYGLQALNYGKLSDVANITQPRFVQTGGSSSGTSSGTSTGTAQQSVSPLGSIIQGGSAVGSALLL